MFGQTPYVGVNYVPPSPVSASVKVCWRVGGRLTSMAQLFSTRPQPLWMDSSLKCAKLCDCPSYYYHYRILTWETLSKRSTKWKICGKSPLNTIGGRSIHKPRSQYFQDFGPNLPSYHVEKRGFLTKPPSKTTWIFPVLPNLTAPDRTIYNLNLYYKLY